MRLRFKTRAKFRVKGCENIQIGYLYKDKMFAGGCYVETLNKKDRISVEYLDLIEHI